MSENNCTFNEDCELNALQCLDGVCACVLMNGFVGENCSVATTQTYYALTIVLFKMFVGLMILIIDLRMAYCYIFGKVVSAVLGDARRVYTSSKHTKNESVEAGASDSVNKKGRFKLNAKDSTILFLIFHEIVAVSKDFGRVLSLTFDTSRNVEEKMKPFVYTFVFLSHHLIHIRLGLAWMETSLKIDPQGLSFLQKNFKKIRGALNISSFVELLFGFFLSLGGQRLQLVGAAVFQLLLFVGALLFFFGGRHLTNKMIHSGASELIQMEAKAIQKTIWCMTLGYIMLEITIVIIILNEYSNPWVSNTVGIPLCIALSILGVAPVIYLDRQGKVLPWAKRSRRRNGPAVLVPQRMIPFWKKQAETDP
mmetsp:Transcript_17103/g.22598  ORF Transcript_17103/g.22598 Transcript_17103/m.22598 type:complete len:366 (+) Transcript_17103:305-1402(+)